MADVALFDEIITQKIQADDVASLRLLLPWYDKTDGHDPSLALFAKALVTEDDGDDAAGYYQTLLTMDPALTPVRLRLWYNHQRQGRYLDAKQQKAALLADPNLPAAFVTPLSASPITKSVGVTYLKDDNVNNAPRQTQHQNWQLEGAKKATGIGYHGDIGAVFIPTNHVRIHPSLGVAGKYYWDNKAHNDTTASATLAISYQKQESNLSFAPYYQKRHFAGRSYSDTVGATIALNATHANWNGGVWTDYADLKHTTRPFLDGRRLMVGAIIGKQHTTHHWQAGLTLNNQSAKDDSEAFYERSLFVSLGHHVGDVGLTHRAEIAKKRYEAPDFFNIKRDDTRYSTRHSLWHSKLHYQGFTPSINWQWERTDSNHFAYKGNSQRLFIEVNKRF